MTPSECTKGPHASGRTLQWREREGDPTSFLTCPGEPVVTDTSEAEGRDRLKSVAFHKLVETLPQWAQDMWKERGKGPGRRQAQTEMINTAMRKNSKGNWEVNLNQPLFSEYREQWQERFGSDQKKGAFGAEGFGGVSVSSCMRGRCVCVWGGFAWVCVGV